MSVQPSGSAETGILPAAKKAEFEPAGLTSFESTVANYGTELYRMSRREAHERGEKDDEVLISTSDVKKAELRADLRRGYRRRLNRTWFLLAQFALTTWLGILVNWAFTAKDDKTAWVYVCVVLLLSLLAFAADRLTDLAP